MLLREKLEEFSFSPNEQILVDYLLKSGYQISKKSTSQIAKETFTSKSTLVRLAQKLNYAGWNDLKKAFLAELTYLDRFSPAVDANQPFSARDPFMTIAGKIAQLESSTIDDTLSLIHHDSLAQATQLLAQAATIQVFALSNNLLISQEFCHNLKHIKKPVNHHHLQSELVFAAELADSQDCALLISYSGESTVLIQVAQLLQAKKIPIVLITSLGENTLTNYADCLLRISTREKLYSKIASFSADLSVIYLLDVLYSCLFSLNYQENFQLKRKVAGKVEQDRSSDTSILKEN